MQSRALWFLALVVPAFAGCMVDSQVSGIERPVVESGTAVAWSVTQRVQWAEEYAEEGEDVERDGGERIEGPNVHVREFMKTEYRLSGEPVYLGVTGIDDGGRYLSAHRHSDLRPLPIRYSFDRDCSQAGCEYDFSIVGRWGPSPYPWLDFPLETGKTWSGEVPSAQRSFGELKWEYRAKVGGERTVSTPLGPLKVVRVDVDERPVNLDEFREAVEAEVRQDEGRLDAFEYAASRRYVLDYSDALGMFAAITWRSYERIVVAGADDGASFRYRGEETREEALELVGMQTVKRPERDMTYIARALGGEIALADPVGVLPSPRKVDLAIESSSWRANAAFGEEATFTATVTENGADASGVEVAWTLLDHANRPVGSAEGTEFAYAFDEPGLYGLRVVAHEQGFRDAVVASVERPFEAYFEADVVLFNAAAVFGVPGRAEAPIPVRPGIKELVLEKRQAVPGGPFDQLVVEDAAGATVEDMDPNRERVRVTDFRETVLGPVDWTVAWDSWIDAGTLFNVHVVMRYDDGVAGADAAAGGWRMVPEVLRDVGLGSASGGFAGA